jgi:predicted transposase YbfD/YdcC
VECVSQSAHKKYLITQHGNNKSIINADEVKKYGWFFEKFLLQSEVLHEIEETAKNQRKNKEQTKKCLERMLLAGNCMRTWPDEKTIFSFKVIHNLFTHIE